MADPVWGLLSKAQDNPQTINEAIAEAIAEHEADPEAHLGAGESIENHRTNPTLDHPAGATLADKLTMSEFTVGDTFADLSKYTLTGDVSNSNWPSAQLYVEWGAVNTSKLYNAFLIPTPFLTNDHDFMFQLAVQWVGSSVNDLDIDFGLGVENGGSSGGLGFVVSDGVVKGIFAIGVNDVYTDDLEIDITEPHVYRAQYIAGEEFAYFFVDGVLKASIAKPVGTLNDDGNLTIKAVLSDENDGNLYISNLFVSRSVVAS